jgi:hypothetical protein
MEYKKIQKERRRSFSRLVFCKPSQQNYKWDLNIQGLPMDINNIALMRFF